MTQFFILSKFSYIKTSVNDCKPNNLKLLSVFCQYVRNFYCNVLKNFILFILFFLESVKVNKPTHMLSLLEVFLLFV